MEGRIRAGPTKSTLKSWLKPKHLWILWLEDYSPSYSFSFWHTNSRVQEHEPEILALLWQFVLSPQLIKFCLSWFRLERAALSPLCTWRDRQAKYKTATDAERKATVQSALQGFFKALLVWQNWWEYLTIIQKKKKKGKENVSDRSTAKA